VVSRKTFRNLLSRSQIVKNMNLCTEDQRRSWDKRKTFVQNPPEQQDFGVK
jgi:hypothetical protein